MTCPNCGYAMDAFDKECPRCHGKELIASTVAPSKSAPPSAPAKKPAPAKPEPTAAQKSCANWGCGCLGAILLLFLAIRLFSSFDPESGKLGNGAAYYMGKRAIESQLKAPSTAKFPNAWDSGVFIKRTGDNFVITSYVDAQNSFGATLRQRWVAVIKRSADGKDMTLIAATLVE